MYVCSYVCKFRRSYVLACMQRTEDNLGCRSSPSTLLATSWPVSFQYSTSVSHLTTGVLSLQTHTVASDFVGPGVLNPDLMFAQQAVSLTEPSPNPRFSVCLKFLHALQREAVYTLSLPIISQESIVMQTPRAIFTTVLSTNRKGVGFFSESHCLPAPHVPYHTHTLKETKHRTRMQPANALRITPKIRN